MIGATKHGFCPILPGSARILILGSMPGEASLAADQYYAHPRNTFWTIMAGVTAIGTTAHYEQRVDRFGTTSYRLVGCHWSR